MAIDRKTLSATVRGEWKGNALGIALVIVSTVAIALVPGLAKLAYEGGSNTLSVITGRSIFSVLIAFLLVRALRLPILLPRIPTRIAIATGIGYAIVLYGYLGAVNYLPVNQVILIYFMHPLLVGVIVIAIGQERLTMVSLIALAAAILGLALAIGVSLDGSNFKGLMLAGVAMVVTALIIVGNARAMRLAPALSVGLHMMVASAVALSVVFAIFGDLALPKSSLGWIGFTGVAIGATTGTLAFMAGMAHIGAARASMISNFEPLLGILFAILLLGEQVTFQQGLGIAIVIGAIFLMEIKR